MSNFVKIPFEVDGINFVSRYDLDSEMGIRISAIPQSVFVSLNRDCIRSLIGDVSTLTRDQILMHLDHINENGSQAFIELGENA